MKTTKKSPRYEEYMMNIDSGSDHKGSKNEDRKVEELSGAKDLVNYEEGSNENSNQNTAEKEGDVNRHVMANEVLNSLISEYKRGSLF